MRRTAVVWHMNSGVEASQKRTMTKSGWFSAGMYCGHSATEICGVVKTFANRGNECHDVHGAEGSLYEA
jgi:hypothetical protein